MNKKVKFLILGFVILIVISVYLISQEEIEPPPAILKIDGKEQISGIGSYCWRGTWKALCAEMIGIPTAQEPLIASSPFTAHLRLPLQEPPYELQLDVIKVTEQNELNLSARGWRWWSTWGLQGKRLTLPLEREQDIELSLEPGLYVLSIEAWLEKGSVSYGFLVKVQASRTNPEPFGNPVAYKDMEVTVLEVEKMEQIVTKGNGEGIYGYMPDGGGYFLIITIKIKNIGHPDNAVYYSTRQFKVVGSKGKTYPFGGDPLDADRYLKFIGGNELFEGEVYGGDAITGRVLRPVDSNDSNLTLRWEADNGVFRYLSLNTPINSGQAVSELPATPISPSVNQTQPSHATAPPVITSIQPDAGTIGIKVVITGTGFTARDNNVAFRLEPEDSNMTFKIGYINNLVSHDGKTIEFVIPELLGACAFPLSENEVCLDIGLNFKPVTQTYPVFIVNQNGTSNSVNFTVSRLK